MSLTLRFNVGAKLESVVESRVQDIFLVDHEDQALSLILNYEDVCDDKQDRSEDGQNGGHFNEYYERGYY